MPIIEHNGICNKTSCVIYVCHMINDESLKRFNKLRCNSYDLYWLHISDMNPSNDLVEWQKPDKRMFAQENPNMVFNYVEFFKKHSQYDFYWFIEYDCVYTGNFEEFILDFASNDSDFLGVNLHHKVVWDNANYNMIKMQYGQDFDKNSIILHMGPIMRLSRNLLIKIDEFLSDKNINPFFDFIIPTIAYTNNMKIEEIGGNSEDFGVMERKYKYYERKNDFYALSNNSTMRVIPKFTNEEYDYFKLNSNILLHPVKINIKTL